MVGSWEACLRWHSVAWAWSQNDLYRATKREHASQATRNSACRATRPEDLYANHWQIDVETFHRCTRLVAITNHAALLKKLAGQQCSHSLFTDGKALQLHRLASLSNVATGGSIFAFLVRDWTVRWHSVVLQRWITAQLTNRVGVSANIDTNLEDRIRGPSAKSQSSPSSPFSPPGYGAS